MQELTQPIPPSGRYRGMENERIMVCTMARSYIHPTLREFVPNDLMVGIMLAGFRIAEDIYYMDRRGVGRRVLSPHLPVRLVAQLVRQWGRELVDIFDDWLG